MSETTKNKYTLETLLPLNVSYDREHILRQQDVDMVNRLVEIIEGSRSNLTPKVGDRMRHVDREGDFYGYALLENFRADKMSVCLAPYVPFVGIGDPDIWLSVSGGPFNLLFCHVFNIPSHNEWEISFYSILCPIPPPKRQ